MHRALCKPLNEIVAIKKMNLESLNCDLVRTRAAHRATLHSRSWAQAAAGGRGSASSSTLGHSPGVAAQEQGAPWDQPRCGAPHPASCVPPALISQEEIIHEAQTMKAYNHPNVLPLYCSFVSGQDLWMVMPFISGGSVLHIMKWGYPEGLDEVTIATIMRDVLKALEYVHKQGGIHRDIKVGRFGPPRSSVARFGGRA